MDQHRFDVFVGLDVGKEHHHATALNAGGKRLHDKALPQDETALREVFTKLTAHGLVLVIVDQPATIGALPVTVARAMGIEVAYLPGWRCAASLISTRATRKPTPVTRSSSLRPAAPCPTRCDASAATTTSSPTWL